MFFQSWLISPGKLQAHARNLYPLPCRQTFAKMLTYPLIASDSIATLLPHEVDIPDTESILHHLGSTGIQALMPSAITSSFGLVIQIQVFHNQPNRQFPRFVGLLRAGKPSYSMRVRFKDTEVFSMCGVTLRRRTPFPHDVRLRPMPGGVLQPFQCGSLRAPRGADASSCLASEGATAPGDAHVPGRNLSH